MTVADEPVAAMFRFGEQFQKNSLQALQTLGELGDLPVGLSEKSCVHREDKIALYRYAPIARSAGLPPLLICYAMVNRPYVLDLQPDRSLIRELLSLGIDVYLLDWGYPDGADRFTGLHEYVLGYLHRCVEQILKIARGNADKAGNSFGIERVVVQEAVDQRLRAEDQGGPRRRAAIHLAALMLGQRRGHQRQAGFR